MDAAEEVEALYRAYNRGEVATVLEAMDPHIAWREAEGNPYRPASGTLIGPDAIVEELFAKLATEWDGFSVGPERFHGAGDIVVVEGRYTGVYKATGRAVDAQFCHVWRMTDGKLSAFQQYTDTGQFQQAMGTHRCEG